MPSSSRSKIRNNLLKKMRASDFALLHPHLEKVAQPRGAVLSPSNKRLEYVYFPEGGVTSIVTVEETGKRTEVGLFGREGMSGCSLMLGTDRSPLETFVQIEGGAAHRIGREVFLRAVRSSETLRALCGAFAQCLAMQVSYTASTNANQGLQGRLARWLLMCHDRVDGSDLNLTHEFLAMMLAIRRSSVTDTLKQIQAEGAVTTSRGTITVLNRTRLEALAGHGYGRAEAEYRRLIGNY
jgi:CRP-like cAMP-binding protein